MTIRTYRVEGMTCGHCARSVEQEVSALADVETATVDLSAATVAVESVDEISEPRLSAAVVEAGYTLAGRA
ncbi:Heavy metal transport/detoxification protein [Microbacterium sp. C448]|uniref:heavy-metal-associated domain-containing protein n=1 Tax=Microbacterium TaxID=33882 RepID=UPI0003DE3DC9|nr:MULTISPECIES: cation transporter [Microbacterium]CDK01362.1 Heavy metal transport/detoxification protein [Microbacterium sp. C448]